MFPFSSQRKHLGPILLTIGKGFWMKYSIPKNSSFHKTSQNLFYYVINYLRLKIDIIS